MLASNKKITARIEDWVLRYNGDWRLQGVVYGHHSIADGEHVQSSKIVQRPDHPKKGDIIETRNTFYMLGEPNKDGTTSLETVKNEQMRRLRLRGLR